MSIEKLMQSGWRFEFRANQLGTYTCVAAKGDEEITIDHFSWWPLIVGIVAACEEYEGRLG